MSRRPPDLTGPAGSAWKLPVTADKPASIGGYLVNCPGQHPFWSWWLVGMCSLRDIPGVPPAHLKYAGAEYEFQIGSINPNACPEPDPDAGTPFPLLRPLDAVIQYHGPTDEGAAAILDDAIAAMLSGEIGPDQDFRSTWNGWFAYSVRRYSGASGASES